MLYFSFGIVILQLENYLSYWLKSSIIIFNLLRERKMTIKQNSFTLVTIWLMDQSWPLYLRLSHALKGFKT